MDETGAGVAEWHREVIETAPVPVVIYDADGMLRYVNEATVEFVDAEDRSALEGEPAFEFVAEDSRDLSVERVKQVVEEREPAPPTELTFLSTDGERRPAQVASAPVTYQGEEAGQAILNDITAQKRREEELRRQRNRFETLFENLPSPVVHAEARDGEPIVRRVNRQFEEVFGLGTADIRGESLQKYIVPPDESPAIEELNEQVLTQGVFETEVTRTTVDGPREFILRAVVREGEHGPPEGYAIYVDITERKESRAALERQNDRLDELGSLIAHDLRNPLSIASGHLELARDGDGDLDRVAEAHDRMAEIVEDLLTLARQGDAVTDPEPVDVEAVAERAWSMCETGDSQLEASVDSIVADESRLTELLENLFRNAIEHNDAPVTVEIGPLPDRGGFYVADDGCGIPPSERDEVFDLGHSSSADGSGLGLRIVERIAEAHGWTVDLVEGEEGGARFEFTGLAQQPPD
jgi:PAS domain S-box-containing protein